jgi:hypothetical protein
MVAVALLASTACSGDDDSDDAACATSSTEALPTTMPAGTPEEVTQHAGDWPLPNRD